MQLDSCKAQDIFIIYNKHLIATKPYICRKFSNMIKYFLLIVSLIFFLNSCKVMTSTDMFQTNPDYAFDPVNAKIKDFIIQPGDQISIAMSTNNGIALFDPNPTGNNNQQNVGSTAVIGSGSNIGNNSLGNNNPISVYYIESDSTVKLPSVGRVKLGGMTLRQAETFMEELLSDDYQKPFVKMRITNRKVTLFYEQATHAQVIPITEEDLTIVDVLAKIGGVPVNSKAYNIKIVRGDRINPKVFNFSVRTISDFKRNNILLESNDIIYIASRPRYVNKTVNEMQPYFLLISTTILLVTFYNQYILK